jgi:hypothetical protein
MYTSVGGAARHRGGMGWKYPTFSARHNGIFSECQIADLVCDLVPVFGFGCGS